MKLTVEVDLDIDEEIWAVEYGVDPNDVREDIRANFASITSPASVAGAALDVTFGPVPVVDAIRVREPLDERDLAYVRAVLNRQLARNAGGRHDAALRAVRGWLGATS